MKYIAFVAFLSLCIPILAAERTLNVAPVTAGPFAVGTANFSINRSVADNVDAGQYQQGAEVDGDLLYINTLLEFPEDAFTFDVKVPNDNQLYGDSAGTTLTYTGYLYYPTSSTNTRENYLVFLDPKLPRMQLAGEKPIFADSSERYPLIMYSHGAGSHPTTYQQDWAEILASHGYIVFSIYHGDDRWGTLEGRRFNLRPLAIKSAIDNLLSHPDYADHIDVERIGGAGESFGGATMAALLGAKTVNADFQSIFSNTLNTTTVDPRIKAASGVVPYFGGGSYTFFGRSAEGGLTIDRPYLANSSNADETADYTKVQAVMQNIPGTKYLVEYAGESHALSAGARDDAFSWTKIFLDAFIKEEPDAIEQMASLATVTGGNEETLVSVTEPAYTATQYLQTNSASANITRLHIINTGTESQSFTGTLYNGSGEQLGDANAALGASAVAANGRLVLLSTDLETTFGVSAWSGPAVLEVKGSAPFNLMSKLVSPSGLISNTNCVREDRVLNIEGANSSNRTFVRFINTTDSTLGPVTGSLYNQSGELIGSADAELLSSLAPRESVWINRDEFASLVGSDWDDEALLEVNDLTGLKLLNLNLVNNETFFNFSCFENSDLRTIYLQTTSASANVSFTHLVNTSEVEQQFTGTLYNGDGEKLGDANTALHTGVVPAKGRVVLSSSEIETAFLGNTWTGPATIEVTGSDSFELMTKLRSPSGLISNTNCTRRDQVHNIEGQDSDDLTFVRFINTASESLTDITGTLYDTNGNVLGAADQTLLTELPAKSAVWLNRNSLAEKFGGATWDGEAMLSVEANAALRLLNLNFINSETFFNFSCYESTP